MSDSAALARLASAASYLLLNAPDGRLLEALRATSGRPLDLARARQDFYDFLCIPHSGCFLPPFGHVLAEAHETDDYWHFPSPRYDGGDGVLPWYDAAGFEPSALPADPMLSAANRPLDHVGVLLAFLATLLEAARDDEVDRDVVREYLGEHIQSWADTFVRLLSQASSDYVALLGETMGDLFDVVRDAYPPIIPISQSVASKVIPIRQVA